MVRGKRDICVYKKREMIDREIQRDGERERDENVERWKDR
jgi:hypothetical protein